MSKTSNKIHLEPNKLNDASAGSAGLVAGEIAGEEDALLNPTSQYLAINDAEDLDDRFKGYALKGAKLYTFITASLFSSFLCALDTTVVSTLMGVIASDLHQIPNMSWIATAFLLSASACQPLYGKLSDIFGRKPILLVCSLIFAFGCTITALKSFPCVIIGRFVTGIGGSGLNAVTTIAFSDIIPLRDRGLYQGVANIAYSMGAASGGVIGGIINDLFGWQFVFGMQVPMALLIWFAIYKYFVLPPGSPGLGTSDDIVAKVKRVDFLGSFFLVLFLVTVLLGANLGNQYFSYESWTFVIIVLIAVLLLLIFVHVELNVAADPILPLTIFSDRTIIAACLTNWFQTMSCFTYMFYFPLYLGSVVQLPSSQVGFRIISNFLGVASGSVGAGLYMKTTGRYYKLNVFSLVVSVLGYLNFLALTPHASTLFQMVILFLPGWAYASMLTISLLALIAAVPSKFQAATTSVQYTSRFTGSTLGVATASAIFQAVLGKKLNQLVRQAVSDPAEAAKIIRNALRDANYTPNAPSYARTAIITAYDLACKSTFIFALSTTSIALVVSLFIREHKLHATLDRD